MTPSSIGGVLFCCCCWALLIPPVQVMGTITTLPSCFGPQATNDFQSQPALFGKTMEHNTVFDVNLQVVPGDPHLCIGDTSNDQGVEFGHEAKAYAKILAPRIDGPKQMALLVERGGCSFEAKARAAMAIDAELRAKSGEHNSSSTPIISFVVVYDDMARPALVPMSASSPSADEDLLSISLVFVSYDTGTTLLKAAKNSADDGLPITIDAAAPWGGNNYILQTNLYGEDYPREFVLAALAGFFVCLTLLGCLLMCAQAGIISTDGNLVVLSLADEILARRQSSGRNTDAFSNRPKLLTDEQMEALPVVEFRSELGAAVSRTCVEKTESMPISSSGGSSPGHHQNVFQKKSHSLDQGAARYHFNNLCDICLEDFKEGEQLLELPACGHKYHIHCIRHWLTTRSNLCPHCRTDVLACDPYFSESLFPRARYGSIGWSDYSPLRYMHDVNVSSESSTSNVGSDEDNNDD